MNHLYAKKPSFLHFDSLEKLQRAEAVPVLSEVYFRIN